jgi:acetyl-CoA carboxylase carboxyl transferase subunit alpha
MHTFLDFELPLKELEEQIAQTEEIGINTQVDMRDKVLELKKKYEDTSTEIFKGGEEAY